MPKRNMHAEYRLHRHEVLEKLPFLLPITAIILYCGVVGDEIQIYYKVSEKGRDLSLHFKIIPSAFTQS